MSTQELSRDLAALRDDIAAVVGPKGLICDSEDMEPYLVEPRKLFRGDAPFVVRPANTEEVSRVVALAAKANVPIVPQGGNTGLVGGGIPFTDGQALVLNLGRMNKVRDLDAENFTMTVEAGCVLQQIQETAADADRLFPLSLGAEGSCQIGGNLSTNAGGVQVLRYGNTRDLVLGLEVVLPDGRIWDGLRALRKDNTGYDLKHLFVGGEGTLGIITAAVLKLYARPREIATAFVGVPSPAAAVELLGRLRAVSGDAVTTFELMPRLGLDFTLKHLEGCQDPLAAPHPWYVLTELYGGTDEGAQRDALEQGLGEGFESGLVLDAALAENETQRQAFWRFREGIVEAQKFEGGSIKHDVAVPVSRIPELLDKAAEIIEAAIPGARPLPFGHVGDGNIHLNVSQPVGADTQAYLDQWGELNSRVHDLVHSLGGSISAEHGLGRLKREENQRFKSPLELELMKKIKQALDPQGLMNPGKFL
ncbi:FAD-binding oxidoreductase [Rhodovibrionaceae bacterium A322]